MRELVLRKLYDVFPFDLRGDCDVPPPGDGILLSCIINFYGRLDLLEGILNSLLQQEYPIDGYEVILVEDRGGTQAGADLAARFATRLNVRYFGLDANHGRMGYARNYALSRSRGKYVLFLDDDTVILQKDFIWILLEKFESNERIDAVVPHGQASYAVIDGKYDYHDPYFMTSRCTAYRRDVLAELCGFVSDFVGQEDVEFVVRFTILGKHAEQVRELEYYHPPLLVPNFRKPKAVGHSFCGLKSRYPFVMWLLVLLNCARHAPLYLIPDRRCREMGRFGIGFLIGTFQAFSGRKEQHYA